MHHLDTSDAINRFKLMEMVFFLCKTKWKKVLSTLAIDWAPMMLLHTINCATLVKEISITHHPDSGPIDSAKSFEIVFIHSYKNHQFQYDRTLNLPYLSKNWVEKKNRSWFWSLFSTLCVYWVFQMKKDGRFTFCKEEKRKKT